MWDTVTSTRHGEVTEAGLYCLGSAVERNGKLVNPLHASHIFSRLLFRPSDLWWARVIFWLDLILSLFFYCYGCPMISKYGPSLSKAVGPVNPSFLVVKISLFNKKIFILQRIYELHITESTCRLSIQ